MGFKGKNELLKVFRISLVEIVVVFGRYEMVLSVKFKGVECGDGVLGLVELFFGFVE